MSILAKNLKTIREELDCTQSMMSGILKVGFRTFVRYEAGERDGGAVALAEVDGMSPLVLRSPTALLAATPVLRSWRYRWLDYASHDVRHTHGDRRARARRGVGAPRSGRW